MKKLNRDSVRWLKKYAGMVTENVDEDGPTQSLVFSPEMVVSFSGWKEQSLTRHGLLENDDALHEKCTLKLKDDTEVKLSFIIPVENDEGHLRMSDASFDLELDGDMGYAYLAFLSVPIDVTWDGGQGDDTASLWEFSLPDGFEAGDRKDFTNHVYDYKKEEVYKFCIDLLTYALKRHERIVTLKESVSWHRSPKTQQEKKRGAAEDDEAPKVRSKRNPKNLPDTYDDIPKSRERSWKKHRKAQYKVNETFSFINQLNCEKNDCDIIDEMINLDMSSIIREDQKSENSTESLLRQLYTYGKVGKRFANLISNSRNIGEIKEEIDGAINQLDELMVRYQGRGQLSEMPDNAKQNIRSMYQILLKLKEQWSFPTRN